jgi:hypothetical protein
MVKMTARKNFRLTDQDVKVGDTITVSPERAARFERDGWAARTLKADTAKSEPAPAKEAGK